MYKDGDPIPLRSRHPHSQVECPRCGALPGFRCRRKDGRSFVAECDAHVERIRAVEEENKIMRTTDSPYAKVECPTCLAMNGEQCRNPKTLTYLGAEDSNQHKTRINLVEAEMQRQREIQERIKNYHGPTEDGDLRVREFLKRYRNLCTQLGVAFSHQDAHGAFIVTDLEVETLIDWALDANTRLSELTPEKEAEFRSKVEAFDTGRKSPYDYESFGDFLSNRD